MAPDALPHRESHPMKRIFLVLAIALFSTATVACEAQTPETEPDAGSDKQIRPSDPRVTEACVAMCEAEAKAEACPAPDLESYVKQCKDYCPTRVANIPQVCNDRVVAAFEC